MDFGLNTKDSEGTSESTEKTNVAFSLFMVKSSE